jgi:hypothetical protein
MNSTSDIVDELEGLKSKSNNEHKTTGTTIDDILKKNIKNIEDILDGKVINIYARPWNKLEPKLKIKKINQYFQDISDDDKPIALKYMNDKKKLSIEYDIEKCLITKLTIVK